MSVAPENYVLLSAVLFFIGVVGVIARRNPLIMLMSIELLFNAANLALVTYARAWANNGLAIVAVTFRRMPFVDIDEVSALKG